jgi:hypothetical protein
MVFLFVKVPIKISSSSSSYFINPFIIDSSNKNKLLEMFKYIFKLFPKVNELGKLNKQMGYNLSCHYI